MSTVSQPSIYVAGDCCIDLVLYGLPVILPMERELLADSMAQRIGGSGAITAHNLAALGNQVGFVYAAGTDSFASFCRAGLEANGVDLSSAVERPSGATGITVLLQHEVERHMFTYAGVTNSLTIDDFDWDAIARARHFHLASFYLQRGLTREIPSLLRRIKQMGLTISMDPNDDPDDKWDSILLDALEFVDVFLPNQHEACRATGEVEPERAIAYLRERVPLLIVKRGAAGAVAYSRAGESRVPAVPVKSVDAIGAGDSFNAGFLHGYVRNWPLEQSLRLGALTGAWSTTQSGGMDAFASLDLLRNLWQQWEVQHEKDALLVNGFRR